MEDPMGLRQEVNLQQEAHSNGAPHTSDRQHGKTGAVGGTSWNYFSEKFARKVTMAGLHTLATFLLHMSLQWEPVTRQSAVDTEPHPKLPGSLSLGRGDIFIHEAQH